VDNSIVFMIAILKTVL